VLLPVFIFNLKVLAKAELKINVMQDYPLKQMHHALLLEMTKRAYSKYLT
jgi:hypothetical protein